MYQPYTYFLHWKDLDLKYYGSKTSKNCKPEDLWQTYFSSSKIIKEFIHLLGDPDVIQVRKVFTNKEDTLKWEHKVLRRLKVTKKNSWINQTVPGEKFYLKENLLIWINDGKTERRHLREIPIPIGYFAGRLKRKWFNKDSVDIMAVSKPDESWSEGRSQLKGNKNPMYAKTHRKEISDRYRVDSYNKTSRDLIPFVIDITSLPRFYEYIVNLFEKSVNITEVSERLNISTPTIKKILLENGYTKEAIKAKTTRRKSKNRSKNNSFLGKKHSDETKKKMSESRRLYWLKKREPCRR